MNKAMFLDTSGLLCLFDTGDLRHFVANDFFKNAPKLITTNYVLSEFIPLAHTRKLKRENAIRFISTFVELTRLELVWITQDMHTSGMRLLENRLDKTYSLCDAVSFVIMGDHRLSDALTTDKHFEQEGFTRLLD
jgi:uncharacterized protein